MNSREEIGKVQAKVATARDKVKALYHRNQAKQYPDTGLERELASINRDLLGVEDELVQIFNAEAP